MNKEKMIPEIRFAGFIDDWEQRKLIEIASYRNGKAHEQDISISGTYIVINSKFVSTNGNVKKYSDRQIEPMNVNDIAFVLSDVPNGRAIARTFLVSEQDKYTLNQRVAGITPNVDTNAYFLHQLMNRHRYFLRFDDGVKQTNLSKKDIEEFTERYPSFEEQNKIGTFFETLDDTIALHQQLLTDYKQLKKAMLQQLFPQKGESVPKIRFTGFSDDWELKELKEFIGEDVSDGDWIQKEHIYESGEYRIVQTGNIGIGRYIDKPESAKYLNQESFDELKANEINPGDILISRLADPAGRALILPFTSSKMVTAVDVAIIRPNKNFISHFLVTRMNSSETLNDISKQVSGTSHKRLSRKNLEKIELNVPNIEEQEKIGQLFKKLDEAIAGHEQKLATYQELKKALLQRMFV